MMKIFLFFVLLFPFATHACSQQEFIPGIPLIYYFYYLIIAIISLYSIFKIRSEFSKNNFILTFIALVVLFLVIFIIFDLNYGGWMEHIIFNTFGVVSKGGKIPECY